MSAAVPAAMGASDVKGSGAWFLQAKNYTRVARESGPRAISLIVLHSSESPEKPGKAMDVARWFAGDLAPQASAHYVVDAGQVVQCVREQDVAWAAPGANRQGVHIELVGFARSLAEDWQDTYSQAELLKAAGLVAVLCARYGIPVVALDALDLLQGKSGITTHAAVTTAFKRSDHTDPGVAFPMEAFVARVASIRREGRA